MGVIETHFPSSPAHVPAGLKPLIEPLRGKPQNIKRRENEGTRTRLFAVLCGNPAPVPHPSGLPANGSVIV